MKGLLLAGGHGTRLRPLTITGNKHMLPIANKPMLLYGLEHLKNAGIEEIGIILGPIKEGVVETLGDGSKHGIDITYIGPSDLSASYGHLGEMSHPEVQEAIDRVFDVTEKAGVATGVHMGAGKTIMDRVKKGYNFVTVGSDLDFVRIGATQILRQLGKA